MYLDFSTERQRKDGAATRPHTTGRAGTHTSPEGVTHTHAWDSSRDSTAGDISPYYFRAMLSENISTSNQLTNMTVANWVTTLPFPYDINNKDLINNEEWVCPSDGIYAVNCRLEMYA